MAEDWKLFRMTEPVKEAPAGAVSPLQEFPPPPPWRDFTARGHRARTYRPGPHEVEMVNAALYLHRPLLVTGKPGTGKSSLIYAVAERLGLGKVLVWPITSRSTVREGLYYYDAIGRLRDEGMKSRHQSRASEGAEFGDAESEGEVLAKYLSLGPLGTALYPSERPRALLIDEIDKADVDFPNDLLHVFEEGNYEIPEARRLMKVCPEIAVRYSGGGGSDDLVTIFEGRVQCTRFPFVVLTSNGERELPPAFLRRCLRLEIEPPKADQLKEIVAAHFKGFDPNKPASEADALDKEIQDLIAEVAQSNSENKKVVATDQLLSVIHMIRGKRAPEGEERERIKRELLRGLEGG